MLHQKPDDEAAASSDVKQVLEAWDKLVYEMLHQKPDEESAVSSEVKPDVEAWDKLVYERLHDKLVLYLKRSRQWSKIARPPALCLRRLGVCQLSCLSP